MTQKCCLTASHFGTALATLLSRRRLNYVGTFRTQAGLTLPITLGLQNGDELNFGVADFWSYFFPFPDVATQFEEIIDAWVAGTARIAVFGQRGRVLEVCEGGQWRSVYSANRLFRGRARASAFIQN